MAYPNIRRLRSSGGVWAPALALVAVLTLVGYFVATHVVSAERRAGTKDRSARDAQQVTVLLEHAATYAGGLADALASEPAPSANRFKVLVLSATGGAGLADVMWVERVPASGRSAYEARSGTTIASVPGAQSQRAAGTSFPARYVTGLSFAPGTDVGGIPPLASTLRKPTSLFGDTATGEVQVNGERGFFLVQGAHFGRGAGSAGFVVIFVPAGWLTSGVNDDSEGYAVGLGGRRLAGAGRVLSQSTKPVEVLNQVWRVGATAYPATQLQSALPRIALALPAALALLVWSVGRGIARRRRAEREVDDVFDLSLDVLCIIDADGYVRRANPALQRTLGYGLAEPTRRPLLDLVYPDDRDATATWLKRLREGQAGEPFEARFVRADGAVCWMEWSARAARADGSVYAVGRDVTKRRRDDEEQAALHRVSRLVAEGTSPAETFSAVAREVAGLIGADFAVIFRYESERSATLVGGWSGPGFRIPIGNEFRIPGGGVATEVLETRGPVRVDRFDGPRGSIAAFVRGLGGRCAVGAPITVEGQLWGVLMAVSTESERLPAGTEQAVAEFTDLVATAVASAEGRALLAASRRRLVEAGDEARRRIERDLHDGAQQRLVLSRLVLRQAAQALGEEGDAAELINEALENTETAIESLRDLARGIHPAILSSDGLEPALKAVARRMPIPVELDVRTDGRLPQRIEETSYFVISEALTNAVKHSGASVVRVGVEGDRDTVRLSIDDDGVGGANAARGSGLVGLRDRVEALGGRLTLRSAPGEGTQLVAELPLQLEAQDLPADDAVRVQVAVRPDREAR